ncbi:hypothetical protein OS188_03525 [Xanthomarina sp. F1114]|uniref:hypothetical protein n=1 Tax=Xanthomarina sp. F1114 TaxID=2996019 RepID=UPI00225E673D|nr:hypothetical protein [Xanthomarina sp. F1114]MCX7547017.1 hypothetical protein [Xanthomarina sp. F1114]
MKNLRIFTILFLSVIALSCSSDDDNTNNDNNPPAQDPGFQAQINGGTFSDYNFTVGVYEITKGTNGNTLSIDIADSNGEMVTLFLNGTGGFSSGTVKEMGNIDSNNFTNYILIRQQQPMVSYYSSSGSVTITNNREHPTNPGHRLISGEFSTIASSVDGNYTTSMTGSFTELEYAD